MELYVYHKPQKIGTRTLTKGLTAVRIETGNFIRVHKEMEVSVGDKVTLGNNKTYTIERFSTLGFAMVRQVS